jgi:hypothetical protein
LSFLNLKLFIIAPDNVVCAKVWKIYNELRQFIKNRVPKLNGEFELDEHFLLAERIVAVRNNRISPGSNANKSKGLESLLEEFRPESSLEDVYAEVNNHHFEANYRNLCEILDWIIFHSSEETLNVFVICQVISRIFADSDNLNSNLVQYLENKILKETLTEKQLNTLHFVFGVLNDMELFHFLDYAALIISQGISENSVKIN